MNWQSLLSSQRTGSKPTSSEASRSAFEQDYDRIIFSHPFRRLQDKTQVHPLPEHDFVHTRLTHSLEVSSVGRSLGRKAGEVIVQRHPELKDKFSLFDFGAIVAAASLAHDLGNPPFGHAGEDALSDFFLENPYGKSFKEKVTDAEWNDLLKFEGNAQGFRIINSNQYGLKLTLATLGAFTKYPCPAYFPARDKSKKSQKKFGFFQSEKEIFSTAAAQLELSSAGEDAWVRHPLTFLVEAADDICYSIIDLEDGCRMGLVNYNDTVELLANILQESFKRDKLNSIGGQNERIGVLRAMTINKLVEECTEVFLAYEKHIMDGSFDKALADHCKSKEALEKISEISVDKIYRARHVVEIEASGHEVLPGLLQEFVTAGEHIMRRSSSRKYKNLALLLPVEMRTEIEQDVTTYEMLRIVLDFVSGLTDRHALSLYRRIKGIAL
ncbi:MAG TPA: deoxyguanosinetriphosphate triphosphohydrolase [Ohtaekwangia sp.]|uniref:deoxyguanosinetriphosphate triphosphohydrolase n=1 Tax=Ohtaekwangia sp. TaxID=2066019 RepID=UPI002F94AE92